MINDIDLKILEYTEKGSGWRVKGITKIDIRVGVYNPIYGSCNVELPQFLKNKNAIRVYKNNDSKCFLYSVILSRFSLNKYQQNLYKFYNKYFDYFNLKNVEFPMKLSKVTSFENKNKELNLCINIYEYHKKNKEIFPLLSKST